MSRHTTNSSHSDRGRFRKQRTRRLSNRTSCLISAGHTKVLVTASLEEGVPGFLRGNVGVRYVKTEPTLKGFRSAPAGGFDAISVDTSYDNWLPSLNEIEAIERGG